MTTDITELALKEKFEVWARSQKLSLAYGHYDYIFSSTEMAWRAVKALSAELAEDLERSQHESAVNWEAAASLAEENEELKRRIAELESRTVKLPRPGFVTISGERMAVYLKADVDAAMLAAGIEESR